MSTGSTQLEELRLLKNKLIKLTSHDNVETVTEEFLDIVVILEQHKISADMIQPSRTGLSLGPAVRNFVNKLKEGVVAHERGLNLLKTWKEIVKNSTPTATKPTPTNNNVPTRAEIATFVVDSKSTAELASNPVVLQPIAAKVNEPKREQTVVSSGKNSINVRRAARTVLQTAFRNIPQSIAERVVVAIEASLDSAFHDKEYASKYRSLAANLKNNKVLLDGVVSGTISANVLVHMTPAELASQEIKETREKIVEEQASGRSMNWVTDNKEKIHESLGIDPNNTWEYDDDDEGLSEPDIETGDA